MERVAQATPGENMTTEHRGGFDCPNFDLADPEAAFRRDDPPEPEEPDDGPPVVEIDPEEEAARASTTSEAERIRESMLSVIALKRRAAALEAEVAQWRSASCAIDAPPAAVNMRLVQERDKFGVQAREATSRAINAEKRIAELTSENEALRAWVTDAVMREPAKSVTDIGAWLRQVVADDVDERAKPAAPVSDDIAALVDAYGEAEVALAECGDDTDRDSCIARFRPQERRDAAKAALLTALTRLQQPAPTVAGGEREPCALWQEHYGNMWMVLGGHVLRANGGRHSQHGHAWWIMPGTFRRDRGGTLHAPEHPQCAWADSLIAAQLAAEDAIAALAEAALGVVRPVKR